MTKRKRTGDVIRVADQGQLERLCNKAAKEGRVAFDTEFVMEDRFEPEVCLVQLAGASWIALVDPLSALDLAPVWGLLCDADVEVVVHAGQEDLALCYQHTQQVPRNIFDVQIAAGLCGPAYPLSLQKLAQQILHVRLHKAKTLTDWRKRPLSPEQIDYAAADVAYLLAIRDKLHRKLVRLKRDAWAREEFRRFEDIAYYRRAEEETLIRVKGSGVLKGRQLAILRELLAWRENVARRWNRPVRVVLKDHLLVEIAKHELDDPAAIRDLRGHSLGARDLADLGKVVQRAMQIPPDQWPKRETRITETPEETALIELLTAVIRSACAERDLAYGLVATKRTIRELLFHVLKREPVDAGKVELLRGWRGELLGEMLLAILSGRCDLRVHMKDGKPALRVRPT